MSSSCAGSLAARRSCADADERRKRPLSEAAASASEDGESPESATSDSWPCATSSSCAGSLDLTRSCADADERRKRPLSEAAASASEDGESPESATSDSWPCEMSSSCAGSLAARRSCADADERRKRPLSEAAASAYVALQVSFMINLWPGASHPLPLPARASS